MRLPEAHTMRFLHTTQLRIEPLKGNFEDFEYAVLSHRWTDDEITFQQFNTLHKSRSLGRGMAKILDCCELLNRATSGSGSTHVALIERTAPSCPRPSIPCGVCTDTLRYVLHISETCFQYIGEAFGPSTTTSTAQSELASTG
jgi:hypothetical protein